MNKTTDASVAGGEFCGCDPPMVGSTMQRRVEIGLLRVTDRHARGKVCMKCHATRFGEDETKRSDLRVAMAALIFCRAARLPVTGKLVAFARTASGLKARDLAALFGVLPTKLALWEAGEGHLTITEQYVLMGVVGATQQWVDGISVERVEVRP